MSSEALVASQACVLSPASIGSLIQTLTDLQAIGGLLFVQSLALANPAERHQTGYLAERIQAHAAQGLATLDELTAS